MTEEEYPDPFEKMANDLVKAGRKVIEETRNGGKPKCPQCSTELWKRKDGDFSCPNTGCKRDAVPSEEIATRKIVDKFTGGL